jgi:Proline dehydrogenase
MKVLERQRAADLGYESPIHDTKAATDANYDRRV